MGIDDGISFIIDHGSRFVDGLSDKLHMASNDAQFVDDFPFAIGFSLWAIREIVLIDDGGCHW